MRGKMSDNSSSRVPTPTEQPEQSVAISDVPDPSTERLARILEKQGVPPGKANFVIQQVTTEIIKAHHGPLPAVEDFAGYDRVYPGSARQILDMAVRQQQHSHRMDIYNAGCEFWIPVLGIGAAALIVVGMLAAGVYLAMNNHENLAIGVFSGTGIATVVGSFLQRRKTEELLPPPPPPKPQQGKKKRSGARQ
jgi:uncharacterized membrane protein